MRTTIMIVTYLLIKAAFVIASAVTKSNVDFGSSGESVVVIVFVVFAMIMDFLDLAVKASSR